MNKIIFCFLILLVGTSTLAQESIKIWGDNPVSSKMNQATLTVFKAQENPSGISVIICPGGSYRYLDRKNEGTEVAQWLNDNNITAFVLFYRRGLLGNRHPAMIQDLQRAMQLVKENSQNYGIDPDKVGLMGFSAGGHLVGTAGTYFDINFLEEFGITPQVSMRPAFVTMIYPVISMTNESIVHQKSRRNLLSKTYSPELAQKMSLEYNVRPDMPPVFLVHCVGDKVVDYRNAVNYAAALTEKGVPHVFKLYDEPGHGFGINPKKGRSAGLWTQFFIPWLEETKLNPN
jgi:acetyl esterase/lipase